MGNRIISGRKKAKVMKIDGETFRLKTPATASDVTKEYPGYVLLDSDAVKHFGVRAKPLEPSQVLRPKKTYFLVELPKLPPDPPSETEAAEEEKRMKLPYRRVTSGVHIGAKERLELLMLSRRSVSDVAMARSDVGDGPGRVRVKLRLPRAQVTKIVEESHDDSEVADKIIGLYMERSGEIEGGGDGGIRRKLGIEEFKGNSKAREKHVSFAVEEGWENPVR